MNNTEFLSIYEVLFYAYSLNEMKDFSNTKWNLPYGINHDFLIDSNFGGLAIVLSIKREKNSSNELHGIRRKCALTIVDTTMRCEVHKSILWVNFPKKEYDNSWCIDFPAETTDLRAGHNYKLIVTEEKTGRVYGEYAFHLFSKEQLGEPSEWYYVYEAGVTGCLNRKMYKAVLEKNAFYNITFFLQHSFGKNLPAVMPELDLDLFDSYGARIKTCAIEPKCFNFYEQQYIVEYPFYGDELNSGVHYAQLKCMGSPISGFSFSVKEKEIPGSWGEWEPEGMTPLEPYTPEAAEERFNRLVPYTILPEEENEEEDDEYDDFDAALDRFIENELKEGCEGDEDNEPFSDDGFIETPELPTSDVAEVNPETETDVTDETTQFSELISRLTGIRTVKEKLMTYERLVLFNRMRKEKNLPALSTPLHAMFLGSPGTGKTTLAKMIGMMLRRAGILSKGHVVVRERSTLLGQHYSSPHERTLEAIEEARGGILLIDEAYQLYQPDDPRDPGVSVIETLMTALSDESKRNWMLILAGYPKETRRMFDMNPGLKSRIPESNIYIFEDFNEKELIEIAEKYLERNSYCLTPDAHAALADRLKSDYSHRDKNFGNARHVINMIQTEIIPAMAMRVTNGCDLNENSLTEILPADIPNTYAQISASNRRIGFSI